MVQNKSPMSTQWSVAQIKRDCNKAAPRLVALRRKFLLWRCLSLFSLSSAQNFSDCFRSMKKFFDSLPAYREMQSALRVEIKKYRSCRILLFHYEIEKKVKSLIYICKTYDTLPARPSKTNLGINVEWIVANINKFKI